MRFQPMMDTLSFRHQKASDPTTGGFLFGDALL